MALILCDIQVCVLEMEINQYDITMAIHYDSTMGIDIARDIHCDVTMSNDKLLYVHIMASQCIMMLL